MKRIFVILLTFVLLLGICPMSALAEPEEAETWMAVAAIWGKEPRRTPGTLVWMVYELLWLMQNPVSLCRPLLI